MALSLRLALHKIPRPNRWVVVLLCGLVVGASVGAWWIFGAEDVPAPSPEPPALVVPESPEPKIIFDESVLDEALDEALDAALDASLERALDRALADVPDPTDLTRPKASRRTLRRRRNRPASDPSAESSEPGPTGPKAPAPAPGGSGPIDPTPSVPLDRVVLLSRAGRRLRVGATMGAASDYRSLLKQDPNDGRARYGLAVAQYDMGQTSAAIQTLDGLLKTRPVHPQALLLRASAAQDLGRRAEARAFFQRYLDAHSKRRRAAEVRRIMERL